MMPNMQNVYPTWLNPNFYQNIPHGEVNWAQLAQQWINMRTVEENMSAHQNHQTLYPQANFRPPLLNFPHSMQPFQPPLPPEEVPPPLPSTPLFPAFESPRFAPRRMPPPEHQQHQSAGLLPTPQHQFQPAHQQDYPNFKRQQMDFGNRPVFSGNFYQQPLSAPTEDHFTLDGPFSTQFQGSFSNKSLLNMQDTDYRKWAPQAAVDDDVQVQHQNMYLDAQQRKNLPAWIREGLEKMEKEKQKQREKECRDEFLKEKQENKWKALAAEGKSRFDDDEEDEEEERSAGTAKDHSLDYTVDEQVDEFAGMSAEEKRAALMGKLRRWLTEILLDVTSKEAESIAKEVHKERLKTARPKVLAQTSALATIISLGGDDDSSTEDEDEEKPANRNSDEDGFKRPMFLPPPPPIGALSNVSKKKVISMSNDVGSSIDKTKSDDQGTNGKEEVGGEQDEKKEVEKHGKREDIIEERRRSGGKKRSRSRDRHERRRSRSRSKERHHRSGGHHRHEDRKHSSSSKDSKKSKKSKSRSRSPRSNRRK